MLAHRGLALRAGSVAAAVAASAKVIVPCRGLLYSPKKGVSREWVAFLQQPIDLSYASIRRWMKRKQYESIVDDHKFVEERVYQLGPDLAAAYFAVARDGAIKFEGIDRWVYKNKDGNYSLPSSNISHLKLEAIDMSQTNVMYNSLDNFVNLKHLKYLNISRSKYIDDWCLDKLSSLHDTLLVLDISGCTQVTERGIACLHRLRKLRRLVMNEMVNVKHFELVKVMLEDVIPGCIVEGHTQLVEAENSELDSTPSFVKQYELAARLKDINRHLQDPNNSDNKNVSIDRVLETISEKSQQK